MTVAFPQPKKGLVASVIGAGLSFCLLLMPGCRPAPREAPPVVETTPESSEPLPAPDAVAFLEKCLERYDEQDIRGYRLLMQKRERVGGTLRPAEEVEVFFRARPFSVFMRWQRGARQAQSLLYVAGENGGDMLVHPTGLLGRIDPVVAVAPNGPQARASDRQSVTDFGLRKTVERTLNDWRAARENGTLRVEYLGVRKVRAAGDRPCYTLRRTLTEPDAEGVTEATIYLDRETWFQVGTVQKGRGGALLGEYMYRDIRLNAEFKPDQFERSALTE